ncbi:MAG: AMP-binding protein [Chloroflexota bacterium]|nr:AMP-binding protein [Chloroflexota bacterium]
MNLFAILEEQARRAPDRAAILGQAGLTTFAELEHSATRLAGAFARRGVARGDCVAVLVPVSRDLYLVLLAVVRLGATAVFVEPALGPAELVRCLERAAPRAFVGVWRAHLLRLRSRALRDVSLAVVAGRGIVPGAISLEDLVRNESPQASEPPADDPAAALLTFTSGTTAAPKVVERSHDLLHAQHQVLTSAFPVFTTDRSLSAAPLFALHDLAAGATVVLPATGLRSGIPRDARRLVAGLAAQGVTLVRANPRFCEVLADTCEATGTRLPRIRALFVGGAPVSASLLEHVRAVVSNAQIHVAYGSSEAEPIAGILADDVIADAAPLTALGRGYCVGVLIPPTAAHIEGANDTTFFPAPAPPIAPSVGEIVVAGPHVNATAWHHTGDTGYFDAQGRLWLLGREADRVCRAGRTMHPYSVEPLVESLPFVDRCALVGIGDPNSGQRSVLVVSTRGHARIGRATRARWRDEIARLCASHGLPIDEIRWTDAIPLDARHRSKVRREEIRRELLSTVASR